MQQSSDRHGPAELPETLAVVADFAARLDHAGVRYCHWKSNEAIGRSLQGINDLDLLIARRDATKFRSVLADLGGVQLRPGRPPHVLGLEDHLLWDSATRTIVHCQPHFELIVGDDMTKSFRVPVEAAMLSAAAGSPIPLPPPELEYLVFLIRMTIKHAPLEALLARKGRLTPSERRELDWLEERLDPAAVDDYRSALFPYIDKGLWDDMRTVAKPDAGLLDRARTGGRLLDAIASDARRSPASDALLKMLRRTWRRVRGGSGHKTLASGGLIVAVVGGDGSGKSSLVESLVDTLSGTLDVRRIHLGKPPRGLLNRVVTRPLRLLRSRGRFEETRLPAWSELTEHPGTVYALWHWLIARDRHRAYLRARRAAGRGALVVSDRFPLAGVASMDGPRLAGLPEHPRRRLARRLARAEATLYRRMRTPDLVLVLRVSPEVAVQRRSDQDTDFVTRRAQEVWDADWSGLEFEVLDASVSAQEVADAALRAIWNRL